jgi:hypothetical protein
LALALAARTVGGATLAVVWPRAREASAILAAQDDPVEKQLVATADPAMASAAVCG